METKTIHIADGRLRVFLWDIAKRMGRCRLGA
jgi:hypothetical protein